MPNSQQLKMEDMSETYLRALCAANGFSIVRGDHDNDGYDVDALQPLKEFLAINLK